MIAGIAWLVVVYFHHIALGKILICLVIVDGVFLVDECSDERGD